MRRSETLTVAGPPRMLRTCAARLGSRLPFLRQRERRNRRQSGGGWRLHPAGAGGGGVGDAHRGCALAVGHWPRSGRKWGEWGGWEGRACSKSAASEKSGSSSGMAQSIAAIYSDEIAWVV